ncbi:hypothetical protein HanXRQr2_Chr10g0442371 [Helianthus annuus]|uniref:Uncharacterized protein n=1 Tax=Helianthus annuus TaxID=4232 RepID=A0A9K3H890_HELAN|nr:hypothetical protein HanXRQr2_Chr14g0649891 [Helianthus annuus]KAF5786557.1 hypothetical protein HanXRQr2_Chr10g0442371 [Helianthus annuus]KAJ0894680.1 hypothetical protein HanPSC8_Chr09g0391741 [Helianthus annuus]KAJ0943980.1 hypothetical protein HanPSC8_Chr03g0110951 [Helianthus annuus]
MRKSHHGMYDQMESWDVVRVMRIIKEQRSRIESLVRLYGNVDVYNVVNISYVFT